MDALCRGGVDFIVVGMTAGVLQGVPAVTFDLDIVYSRDPANVQRLGRVLSELDAYFRTDRDRRIAPNASHLESAGHKLLLTKLGPLDVLGSLEEGEDYDTLLADSAEVDLEGLTVRALSLARLIVAKERANRDKDRAVLPLLRSTLARSKKE